VGGLVEFGLLGLLKVVEDGRVVPIPAAKQRVLLACLLLRAGELVTVDKLAEAIWGTALPADPRRVVQVYVTRLRKLLRPGLLQSRPEGYVLAVDGGNTDLGQFALLLEQAGQAAEADDRQAEAALLRQALGLWRGEALADVPSEALHRDVARLTEQRLEALQRRIEADLALGRHAELVSELRVLTDRYPLREKLWAQLMTALYRCGRQADALQAFTQARDRLVEELGIEPAAELQRLQHAILTGDPALAVPPAPVRPEASAKPSQLPVDVGDFVGRAELVSQIEQLLAGDQGVGVVALSGPPGVGKTALAVHAAHRLAQRFGDGQLYVNLHGATAGLQPLAALEVLGRFLRALGTAPGAVPTELDEASALFRSRMAGRRVLLVLDNAADAAQVAALLPASPGCAVLVTSRRVLSALEGATHLALDVLDPAEAVTLLGRVAGAQRVAAEPEATAELARWCGRLPLALRIAGARLAARSTWPVAALAERLADARRRLDELELAEVGVRASFQVSYQQLSDSSEVLDRAAADAFGLLGGLESPEVGVPVAARLLERAEDSAERVLERLVDAQLLETPAPGRYRLHDLLRLYAREHHPEPERSAALTRALGFYVASTWQTLGLLRPGDYRLASMDARWAKGGLEFADEQSALGWLEDERANLLAAVEQAAATPGVPSEIAIQLAHALFGFFVVRSHWQDWLQANQTALGVARRMGDLAAQAQAHNDLGSAYLQLGQPERALGSHQESLALRRRLGDRLGQAASLNNMGNVQVSRGHHAEALACQQESLTLYRELGYRRGEATCLTNLGSVHIQLGRYAEALACHMEGLAIDRELGDRYGQAYILCNLGVAHQQLGHHAEALACQQESLAIRRELGDPEGQAQSLRELGMTLRALGRHQEARAHWQEALAIFERLRTSDADQVRVLLSEEHDNPQR
jgi:DNA-binding SARP family transcriptional activator